MIKSQVVEIGNQMIGLSAVHVELGIVQYLIPVFLFYMHFRFQHDAFASVIAFHEVIVTISGIEKQSHSGYTRTNALLLYMEVLEKRNQWHVITGYP